MSFQPLSIADALQKLPKRQIKQLGGVLLHVPCAMCIVM